ncbi:MAG: hypothetical protein LBL19_04210 [Spirochaetaceae bacterium]|nr:hypothetical protein [Spirochaetaceae bacterium]
MGRLEDGRTFAVVESRWRPALHIPEEGRGAGASLLAALPYQESPAALEPFSGKKKLLRLDFSRYADRAAAVKLLEQAGIPSPDGDAKPPEAFLLEKRVRGPVELRGPSRPGRFVDVVFLDPEMLPAPGPVQVPLKIASVDIETDMGDGSLRAVGISWSDALDRDTGDRRRPPARGLVRVLGSPDAAAPLGEGFDFFFHPSEVSLLRACIDDIRRIDPDVITGWNFLDFDFPRLAERCGLRRVPFNLGRTGERAKYFPGEGRRSGAALVPGRQVLDALRIVRSGPQRFADYTLQTVSREVLGEGKLVASSGKDKTEELDRLYREDLQTFGAYCYRDAELVLRILAGTGLFRLTRERAVLTGVSLDKAWTSVVSFERIYALELGVRGIAPPPSTARRVSGAAGGTVLEPRPGLFRNIAVFDFRSLYPTIIQTFNIDPLAHERARSPADSPGEAVAPAAFPADFPEEAADPAASLTAFPEEAADPAASLTAFPAEAADPAASHTAFK